MTPRAPDPRTLRTRRAILASAEDLLADDALGEVTIARIAKAAGISVGSIYLHFENKDELLRQLVARAADRHQEAFDAAALAAGPIERVLALGDAYVAFAVAEPVAVRVLSMRAVDPPPGDQEPDDLLTQARGQLLAALEQAAADGDLGDRSPQALLLVLVGVWSGIAAQFARRGIPSADRALADEVREATGGLLAAGLHAAART